MNLKTIAGLALGYWIYTDFIQPSQKHSRSIKGLGSAKDSYPSWKEFRSGKPLHYTGFDNRDYIANFIRNSDIGVYSIKWTDSNGRMLRNLIMPENEIENFYNGVVNPGVGLGSLKKYKWQPAYIGNKTTLTPYVGKSGVYLIKDKGKIIYVGKSGYNLYKTITRHFQEWNDIRPRIVYYDRSVKVRVILCTPSQADRLEKALIISMQPRDNWMKYDSYTMTSKDAALVEKAQTAVEEEVPF